METPKLTKSVPAKIQLTMPLRWVYTFAVMCLLAATSLGFFFKIRVLKSERSDQAEEARRLETSLVRIRKDHDELRHRLVEMTVTAGAYRAYVVYHDCVQQNLGIYQMEEVARAYDRHFRSTELTAQCLAESSWYETHPHGINPAHLNR